LNSARLRMRALNEDDTMEFDATRVKNLRITLPEAEEDKHTAVCDAFYHHMYLDIKASFRSILLTKMMAISVRHRQACLQPQPQLQLWRSYLTVSFS
jgi:hypothetical protein